MKEPDITYLSPFSCLQGGHRAWDHFETVKGPTRNAEQKRKRAQPLATTSDASFHPFCFVETMYCALSINPIKADVLLLGAKGIPN